MPAPGDPAPLLHRLIGLVNRKGLRESMAFMHQSGLTMPQIVTLFALRRWEASVSELAERLHMSLPATSQLVDRLVEAGLVSRTESLTDRRVRRLSILSDGLRFLERFGELRGRELGEALSTLTPGTRALFATALGQVVAELEEEIEGAAPPAPRPRRSASRRKS
jgi:MarR family transcriptional regulator, organic hydroperoxide resistance regulator